MDIKGIPFNFQSSFHRDIINYLKKELENKLTFNPLFIEHIGAGWSSYFNCSISFQSSFHRVRNLIHLSYYYRKEPALFQSSFHRGLVITPKTIAVLRTFQSSFHRVLIMFGYMLFTSKTTFNPLFIEFKKNWIK